MDAACSAFFAHGFEGASIEAIAADAGVSKVTVYNHFGTKQALLGAAVEAECEKMRDHLDFSHVFDAPIRKKLERLGAAFQQFLSRPEIVTFDRRIAAESERDPEIGRAFLEAGPRRMKVMLAMMIGHAVAAGELEVDDPEMAAEQFASMCKGMGEMERRYGCDADPERDTQRIAAAVETFMRAYGAKN
ncbi:TetR/AcrR family transcriptional regulator [Sphingomicrobium sediminis]|uniref:TetR/AcrR family transcriptional regulator n=1 Tax=Sphingomicrobium sediminis TaxID=2950949 RepID=A0A9X2EIZ3_9SPHN|nr:TetR/AcrR family transcriptional regulator [Sphingomicrobium sediminis]